MDRLRNGARDAVRRRRLGRRSGVRRLAQRQIDAGIHFLVPCGTTGESPTLSEDERVRIVELVVEEAAGRVPGARGCGRLRHARSDSRRQADEAAGAAGILSVTPYYNKPTQEGLYQHYRAIAGEVGLPIIVYNVPGRTGCERRGRDAGAAERESTCIAGVKEASGNMAQICDVLRRGARRVRGTLGRRFADAAVDGGRWPRDHLGRVERSAGRDGADGRARRRERLRGGATHSSRP